MFAAPLEDSPKSEKQKRQKREEEPEYLCSNTFCRFRGTIDDLGPLKPHSSDPHVQKAFRDWLWYSPPEITESNEGCLVCGAPVMVTARVIKDPKQAQAAASEGVGRVMGGVNAEWKYAAVMLIGQKALAMDELTADDLYPEVQDLEPLNEGRPVNLKALGGAFVYAKDQGFIEPVIDDRGEQQRITSVRAKLHKNGVRLWRSCIYGQSRVEPVTIQPIWENENE